MTDDDKIKPIGVKFKLPPGEDPPMLQVISQWASGGNGCNHRTYYQDGKVCNVTYHLREGETEVECGHCNTRIDPMFVLRLMAHEETQWARNRERYMDEMKRLRERSRTKCYHCGQMTEISRR